MKNGCICRNPSDPTQILALNWLDIHQIGPPVEDKEEGTRAVEVAEEGELAQEEDVR